MNDIDIIDKQKSIFGRLFLLSNKLQATGDRVFADDMTNLQWLLTVAIAQSGNSPPTISQMAKLMGSSRQNVKQLALKLQAKGFLIIEKDRQDFRATRLILTEKSHVFWKRHQDGVKQFLAELFTDLTGNEIDTLYNCLNRLYESILRIEKCKRNL